MPSFDVTRHAQCNWPLLVNRYQLAVVSTYDQKTVRYSFSPYSLILLSDFFHVSPDDTQICEAFRMFSFLLMFLTFEERVCLSAVRLSTAGEGKGKGIYIVKQGLHHKGVAK